MTTRVLKNGRIFTAKEGDSTLYEALVVEGDKIVLVGTNAEADKHVSGRDVDEIDLKGSVVLPGILDGHVHILQTGSALTRVPCLGLDVKQIQDALVQRRKDEPQSKFLLGVSFLFDALGAPPNRAQLDEVVPDIPVFIDAADLHSCWVNTAALEVMGITRDTPNPVGGEFEKDEHGELTGLLKETAFHDNAWPWIADHTPLEQRVEQLDRAFEAFLSTGVTGAVEMAMMDDSLEALEAVYKRDGKLPMRMSMHWFIRQTGNDADREARVREAAGHKERLKPMEPWLRMVGIKVISDGVIDSCTAYMKDPFPNGANPDPIWPREDLTKVMTLADSLGLQIACHALGDAASEQALDCFEAAYTANGVKERRHRIEHLEVVTNESIQRLTKLGIVASLQPLHADPVYAANWRKMLGEDHRCDRAFPFAEFTQAGSRISFGTDAPVAPYHALPNMYSAATRESVVDPDLPPSTDPRIVELKRFCFDLESSIRHYTAGTAWSTWQDDKYGTLEKGKSADFCVLNVDPFRDGVTTLRRAQNAVTQTWIAGDKVWEQK